MFVFQKIWLALFSCYFHFGIRLFARLPTKYAFELFSVATYEVTQLGNNFKFINKDTITVSGRGSRVFFMTLNWCIFIES